MSDYYGEYQERIDELKQIEQAINSKILEINNIGKNGSTFSLEKEVSELLKTYDDFLSKLRIAYYNASKIPSEMPTPTVNKRKLQIEELELNYKKLETFFENSKKKKYKMDFVDNGMSEETKERIKHMSNEQLLSEQKYLITKQNERLYEINKLNDELSKIKQEKENKKNVMSLENSINLSLINNNNNISVDEENYKKQIEQLEEDKIKIEKI